MKLLSIIENMDSFFAQTYYQFLHSHTREVLLEVMNLLSQLWYWVVLGVFMTVLIKRYISKDRIRDFFLQHPNISIVLAALAGVVSPIGSYAVIPITAALFLVGTPIAPLVAFLIASPLINPTLFFLTAGALGFEIAILRVVSAFLLGTAGGYAVQFLMSRKVTHMGAKTIQQDTLHHNSTLRHSTKRTALFVADLYKTTKYIGKYFLLGILIAALVKIVISPAIIYDVFGRNQILAIIYATGAGVPLYTCGGAAIPVMQEMAEMGMNHGAILAFFISGPATRISTLVLMKASYERNIFLLYLFISLIGAVAFGTIYSFLG